VKDPPVSDPPDVAVNETIRSIYRRHSVRLFTDRPVSDEDLRVILAAANQAPSAHNQQAWRFIVIRKERTRLELAEMVRGRAGDFSRASSTLLRRAVRSIVSAPVIVAVANTGELTRRGSESPEVYEEAGGDVFRTMEIQSSAAAVENLLLAAASLGIGSVWLGILVLLKREVLEFLGEPAGELMAVVALGYPAARTSGPKKLPLETLVRYLD
jgi:nitroreductase